MEDGIPAALVLMELGELLRLEVLGQPQELP